MKLSDLKNRLQQLNNHTSKKDLWKPKDEHVVRLLRDPHSKEPMKEIYFHYNIGDSFQILCPKMNFGDECVICDFAEKLKSWNDEDGNEKPESTRKADFELFKKMQAGARVFSPMVEREDGETLKEDSARWWGMTPNQSLQILELCGDGERLAACGIDPTDEEAMLDVVFGEKKAFDLQVSFRKPGEKGNNKTFTQVVIGGKITPRPILKDAARVKDLLSSIKPIEEIYPKVTSEEVAKKFEAFVNAGLPEAKDSGKDREYPANTKEDASKKGGRSIDEAFGDMVDDNKPSAAAKA